MRTSDWSSDVCSSDLTEPVEAAIAILRQREAGVASFNQTEPDIAAFMTRPWVVTSSDASCGHPRYYASYARKYATYVKDKSGLDLGSFIAPRTAVHARLTGQERRAGRESGALADALALQPDLIAPCADSARQARCVTRM